MTGASPGGEGPAPGTASGPDPLRRALLSALPGAAVAAGAAAAVASTPGLEFTWVAGAGGAPLNMAQAGRRDAPAILFIHGMSQSYLSFEAQLLSDLAQRFHLVAYDLRGHGNSAKPWRPEDYADSRLWADDLAAVMAAARLTRPTLVAWSFGGGVAMDYVRHYGAASLTALNLVGDLGGLVPPAPRSPAVERIWASAPLRQSPDIRDNIDGFRKAAATLSAHLTRDQQDVAFATGLMQGGLARRALAGRKAADNADLRASLRLPVLISLGALDPFTSAPTARAVAAGLPAGRLSVYDDVGHFVSAEQPTRFNRELAALAGASSS